MPSLHDLQARTYHALTNGSAADDLPWLRGGRLPSAVRLEVYRNNLYETARKTLASCYPVIEQLVGAACLRNLARAYVRLYPSRRGDLAHFGAHFARHLADIYNGTEYSFLVAVAELEWACIECQAAPDAAPFDIAVLESFVESDYPHLRLELHPAVRLIEAESPVLTIWRAHMDERLDGVDPRSGAERVLVYREGLRTALERVDAGVAAFIRAIGNRDCLQAAQTRSLAVCPDFDAAATICQLHSLGLLVGVTLPGPRMNH
jgi:hypothetical protein